MQLLKTVVPIIFVISLAACGRHYPAAPVQAGLIQQFTSLEDSSIQQPVQTNWGINTGWSIYKDIMFAGTGIEGSLTHNIQFAKGRRLLNCRITGGDAYNNLFFTNTLARQWKQKKWHFSKANAFSYSMHFYVDNLIDCNNGNRSELEGLEFTFQKATPPQSYLWGLQWSKANVWSYWDDTRHNGRVKGWVTLPGLTACISGRQWNHIRITGYYRGNQLYYSNLYLNGKTFALNVKTKHSYLPGDFAENYLQAGFQINGNKAVQKNHPHGTDPVSVYLDDVSLQVSRQ
jgi:hypothetical protein